MTNIRTVKIEVFIPEGYIEALLDGLHKAGAGKIGNYDHCVSISRVRGYWRPLEGAQPFAGKVGEVASGSECKVEVNCSYENISAALEAIHHIHPYEEPLINVVPLLNDRFPGAS